MGWRFQANRWPLGALLAGVLLIGLALARHPVILAADRTAGVVADVLLLLAYAAAAIFFAREGVADAAGVLGRATLLGVVAGLVLAAHLGTEYLVTMDGPAAALGLPISLLVAFACFAAAGASRTSGGAIRGLWAAMIAMLVLWLLAWAMNQLLENRLEVILSGDPDYQRGNTLRDLPAYVAWNTLSAALSHALLLPMLGAAFGISGARLRRRSRRAEAA